MAGPFTAAPVYEAKQKPPTPPSRQGSQASSVQLVQGHFTKSPQTQKQVGTPLSARRKKNTMTAKEEKLLTLFSNAVRALQKNPEKDPAGAPAQGPANSAGPSCGTHGPAVCQFAVPAAARPAPPRALEQHWRRPEVRRRRRLCHLGDIHPHGQRPDRRPGHPGAAATPRGVPNPDRTSQQCPSLRMLCDLTCDPTSSTGLSQARRGWGQPQACWDL